MVDFEDSKNDITQIVENKSRDLSDKLSKCNSLVLNAIGLDDFSVRTFINILNSVIPQIQYFFEDNPEFRSLGLNQTSSIYFDVANQKFDTSRVHLLIYKNENDDVNIAFSINGPVIPFTLTVFSDISMSKLTCNVIEDIEIFNKNLNFHRDITALNNGELFVHLIPNNQIYQN